MSPEQARGEKGVDHRADLYAVAAMLYRCTCGRVPYRGRNYNQILAKILAQPPPPVRHIRPEVPALLAEVIARGMSRSLEERYSSAAELAADLAEFTEMEISISGSYRSPAAQTGGFTQTGRGMTGGTDAPGTAPPSAPTRVEVAPSVESDSGSAVVTPSSASSEKEGWTGLGEAKPGEAGEAEERLQKKGARLLSSVTIGGLLAFLALVVAGGIWFAGLKDGDGSGGQAGEGERKGGGAAPAARPLRFGLGQHLPKERRHETMDGLARYLQDQLDRPVKPVIREDFENTGKRLARGTLDLAYFSPLLYVRAKKSHPEIRVLCRIRSGQRFSYQGLILARVDKHVRKMEDLKGKRFCWVARSSTSGYLFPRMLLSKAGLDPDTLFSKEFFTRYHTEALRKMDNGVCDGAAVFASLYYEAKVRGKLKSGIRIVAATGPIPQDVVVASPHLPDGVAKQVTEALLRYDPEKHTHGKPLGSGFRITSFIPADDSVYEPVREAVRLAKSKSPERDDTRETPETSSATEGKSKDNN
jgi:phosphate/phosphite/phosphonate ABC transporter binding protein